ncbi:MAG TPA: hypothetical protein VFA33_29550 [Bryobacteraceae bacterium]|nr:hypothetical protein [Bryobacteraceae bacterium]
MRLALFLTLAAVLAAAQDAQEIVRRSLVIDEHNDRIARDYTFLERRETWEIDGDGQSRNRRVRTYDVTLLEGSPYRRLVERDDRPLAPDEEAREEEKLHASIAERQKETPAQRARRLEEWEKKRRTQREYLGEIPDAFQFRLLGEERLAGRDAWVVAADPLPGYRPRTSTARLFPHLRGKLWIDKQDSHWIRAEAEVVDTISFGFFVARIGKGTRAWMQQTLVNGEVWLPQQVVFEASARIALVRKLRVAGDIRYRNYRKFQAESRVLPAP